MLSRLVPGLTEFTEAERSLPPIAPHILETHELQHSLSQPPEKLPSLRACHKYFEEADLDPLFQTLKEQVMAPEIPHYRISGGWARHPFFRNLNDLWINSSPPPKQLEVIRGFIWKIEEIFRADEVSRGIETGRGMFPSGFSKLRECVWYMGGSKKHKWTVGYRGYAQPITYPKVKMSMLKSIPVFLRANQPATDASTAGLMIGLLVNQIRQKKPLSGLQSFLIGIYDSKAYVASAQWSKEYLRAAVHRSELPAGLYTVTRRSVMFDLRKPEERGEFVKVYYVLRIAFQKGLIV
ncbi:hypothetical protein C8J56DRAFT_953160 [Mycena floridula]|nr:hypothetical protein C8J56DRAFT_953160 [Mycena floridula]